MSKAQSRTARIAEWLETHWVTPAYGGWLLGGLSVFFFIAATNTLAGWLYVLSGIGLALLAIAAILPERILRNIQIHRNPIHPVSVGDQLTIELILVNPTKQPKPLFQVVDLLPYVLGNPVSHAIETIPADSDHRWVYFQPTSQRGVYRWQTVNLRTAAPLGLFWCQRSRITKATAIVYPTVLPLAQCPLVDEMGQDTSLQLYSDRRAHSATEGLTRSLRPYRHGDPTRLIHWRSSARHGELRVREMEIFTGGQELVICLDSALVWQREAGVTNGLVKDFEQAVVVAASLYFYACQRQLRVKLWTASAGLLQGRQAALETLAAVQPGEDGHVELPTLPVIWLTQNPDSLADLPAGSRWILWSPAQSQLAASPVSPGRGLQINPNQPLQVQLERPLPGKV